MPNSMPNKKNIVFCIWLGFKMPEQYIYRMNTVFVELYSSNANLQFILYTDNPNSILKQFTTHFDMLCMLKKIQIKSTETLFAKYDELVSIAIKHYQQNYPTYLTTDKYFIQYPECKLPERTHHNAWAYLHTCVLHFLYIKKLYHARVVLNLRLIALMLHGGLYFDVDIMSQNAVKYYNFDKSVAMYLQCKKDIRQFILVGETFNDFMKFVKKISQKYGIEVADYSNDVLIFLDKLKNICIARITSAITDYNICNKSNTFTELNSGFYAISNYITKANANGAFSQNVLYVNTIEAQREIEEATIYSLVFNMYLSSLEPKCWNLMKVLGGYKIVASRIDNRFQMPFDVFLSREKYPLLINKTECDIEIAYRTGRPLHPIGQIATRGCWNFIVNKFSQFPYSNSYINSYISPSSTTHLETFHVSIYNTVLYPESAVIDSKSIGVHSSEHWTKVKNKKNNII